MFRQVPFHHRHSVGQILFVVSLVLSAATSLRGTSRVIEILKNVLPLPLPLLPCSYWTGRLWLLRLPTPGSNCGSFFSVSVTQASMPQSIALSFKRASRRLTVRLSGG